jgi:hypothetical protein
MAICPGIKIKVVGQKTASIKKVKIPPNSTA